MPKMLNILFLIVFTFGIAADEQKKAAKQDDHVKFDLALVQSMEAFEQSGFGQFLAVGGDADPNWCDYSTLQAAINAAEQQGITSIRVAYNKTYFENLMIDDIDVSLVGGYASCQSARAPFSSPNSTQASINGGSNSSVITISGETQKNNVLLRNLRLSNGSGTEFPLASGRTSGGGILTDEADAKVTLDNVDVRDNSVNRLGGGIYVRGGDTDMLLVNSRVFLNSAQYGGGISCTGGLSSVVLAENSGVNINTVSEDGGGVYISQCYFGQYSGTAESGLVGVSSNRADKLGGGIFAIDATVSLNGQESCNGGSCLGDNTNPASVVSNESGLDVEFDSEGSGGGIYAQDSTVTINAGLFEGNTATRGGGIYLRGSDLTVGRSGGSCWDGQRCNFFLSNSADDEGGAITQIGGDVDISSSFFEQNTAVSGAAISILGLGVASYPFASTTRIEGSVFNNNGNGTSVSIVSARSHSDLEIIHSTIADNTLSTDASFAAIIRMDGVIGTDPALGIYSSILDNPGFANLDHDMSDYEVSFSCIITDDTVSLSSANDLINTVEGQAGGARILNTIAGFADRANRDYSLVAGAAAIDYCNTPTYVDVNYKDIDFQQRGVDDPDRSDYYIFSFFDIGADEAYVGPFIFSNGFE